MATRKRKKSTRRRVFHRRRAHTRTNPPVRRRRRNVFSRARRRTRRYRRNPGLMGGGKILGMSFPPIKRVAGGLVGLAAARALPGYAKRFLPVSLQGGVGDLLLGALSGMVAGMAASKVMGKQFGEDVAFGAILGVADDAARMYVYPAVGLSAYLEPNLGAYLSPRGLNQYLSPGATIASMGNLEYDFQEDGGDDLSAVDVPSRLDSRNRL